MGSIPTKQKAHLPEGVSVQNLRVTVQAWKSLLGCEREEHRWQHWKKYRVQKDDITRLAPPKQVKSHNFVLTIFLFIYTETRQLLKSSNCATYRVISSYYVKKIHENSIIRYSKNINVR